MSLENLKNFRRFLNQKSDSPVAVLSVHLELVLSTHFNTLSSRGVMTRKFYTAVKKFIEN